MPYSNFNPGSTFLADYVAGAGLSNYKFDRDLADSWASSLDPSSLFSSSTNSPDLNGDLLSSTPFSGNSDAWTFITAPGTVSYSQNAEVNRVQIFGSNTPPVTVGSVGMRDLTLSEALMEGFTLGRSVQKQLDDLEKLMDVEIDSENGFVNVPVYNVKAGEKTYGLFVIEQVEVDEIMRDLQGAATRAMVGVTLKEVPAYQVGTGIDQAGASTGGQALDASKFNTEANKQADKIAKNKKNTPSGSGSSSGSSASGSSASGSGNGSNSKPPETGAARPGTLRIEVP